MGRLDLKTEVYFLHEEEEEAAWPSGQRIRLIIQRSWVQVPLLPLCVFVLSRPELKSSAMLVNSQLVHLLPVGVFNPVMLYLNYLILHICMECL